MIYVTSDVHGCFDKFMKLLKMIDLKGEDTLYILGDLVDRGPRNVDTVIQAASRKNIRVLMGNHDYLASLMIKKFCMDDGPEDPETLRAKAPELWDIRQAWLSDGGEATREEIMRQPKLIKDVIRRFLGRQPVFEEITVNGQTYHLSHSVPEREKLLDTEHWDLSDFLFGSPEYDKVYFPDKILVTGHTPTGLIEEASAGRIWKRNNHIAVDCGAVFGGPLGCICLDTGEEYYAE